MDFRKILPSVFGVLLVCLGFCPQIAFGYNLGDAVSSALLHNESIKMYGSQLEQARIAPAEAFTKFLPKITFVVDATKINPSPLYRDITNDQGKVADHAFPKGLNFFQGTNLNLEQPIFSFGSTMASYKSAKLGVKASEAEYAGRLNELYSAVVTSYSNVRAYRSWYKVTLQQEESLRNIVSQAELLLSLGAGTKSDLLQAQTQLLSTISNKEQIFSNLKEAEAQFLYNTGEVPPVQMMAIDSNGVDAPTILDEYISQAQSAFPSVIQAKYLVESAKEGVKANVAGLLPTLSFRSNILRYQNDPAQWNHPQSSDTYMFELQVPIFQQGLEYVHIKESRQRLQTSRYALKNQLEWIASKAVSIWSQYQALKLEAISSAQAVKTAEDLVKYREEELKLGSKTIEDLVRAQVSLYQAQTNFIQTQAKCTQTALSIPMITNTFGSLDLNKISIVDDGIDAIGDAKPAVPFADLRELKDAKKEPYKDAPSNIQDSLSIQENPVSFEQKDRPNIAKQALSSRQH